MPNTTVIGIDLGGTKLAGALFTRSGKILQKSVVFRMLFDQVGSRDLGAFKDLTFTMFAPSLTEEAAHLLA